MAAMLHYQNTGAFMFNKTRAKNEFCVTDTALRNITPIGGRSRLAVRDLIVEAIKVTSRARARECVCVYVFLVRWSAYSWPTRPCAAPQNA